jgi:hypothetical protein
MLRIQTHIKNHGLKKTIEKFSLNSKEIEHRLYLKYDQLRSPKNHFEVHECRGLILHKDTFDIISMPFERFFGHDDFYSSKLNWGSTIVMEKRDGTLMQVYWDEYDNQWRISTMFSEGEEEFRGTSFKLMFIQLMNKYGSSFELFNKGCTYIFELTSPANKVVVTYKEPELRLIGMRDLGNLREMSFEQLKFYANKIKVPIVETFSFCSLAECLETFKNMSFNFEGYVAFDGFNRIKIKNPAYVAVHLTQSQDGEIDLTKPYLFLDVIKGNEIDEFKTAFPQAEEIVDTLNAKYNVLMNKLLDASAKIKPPKNITKLENKLFASAVSTTLAEYGLEQSFASIFFLMKDGKINSIEEYILRMDNKILHKVLTKL